MEKAILKMWETIKSMRQDIRTLKKENNKLLLNYQVLLKKYENVQAKVNELNQENWQKFPEYM